MNDEKQEMQRRLDMLPKHMQSVKDAILDGKKYWYPLEYDYLPTAKTVVYQMPVPPKKIDVFLEFLGVLFEKAGIRSVTGFHPYSYEDHPTWRNISDIKTFIYEKDKYECGFDFENCLKAGRGEAYLIVKKI